MTNPALADAINAAHQLRDALTGVSQAIEGGELSKLLDAEPVLDAAVTAVIKARRRLESDRMPNRSTGADVDQLKTELDEARTVMARCAVLGAVLDDFIRGRCQTTTYTASGAGVSAPVRGSIEEQV